ncbi:MAG: SMP-30/gluconolactonase/LRE family protein [Geminicoccaceae bacterium]
MFFDGLFTTPRLQHPEGIAVAPDGAVWVGSENGQILRIAPDGSGIEEIASSGGFTLGIAFDGRGGLFACDLKSASVLRLDLASRRLERFTPPGIKVPNWPVVDARRSRLLVSDSHDFARPGPGIWSYDLATGTGGCGMRATSSSPTAWRWATAATRCSSARPSPGAWRGSRSGRRQRRRGGAVRADLPGLPDGLAFDAAGNLFVACYEPSRILRLSPDGRHCDVYIEDATAHLFAHPTNIAFDGSALYAANLGRWHVTRVETDTTAPALSRTLA